MPKLIKSNKQIDKITAQDLQKPAKTERYDSTIDERDRTCMARKPEPRFGEYR